VNWPPHLATWENPKIFYFPWMIKFANFEFIFAIRGLKLAMGGVEDKFFKHKIGGFFFYLHLWNDLELPSKGANSPRPLVNHLGKL